jgi:hypothetical protein
MQARYLTVNPAASPHHAPTPTPLEPDAQNAIKTLDSLHLAAITEFYHESWCVLLWRTLGSELPLDTIPRQHARYIQNKLQSELLAARRASFAKCTCAAKKEETQTIEVSHITHHKAQHINVTNLPHDLLEKIDFITQVDRQLFIAALARFFLQASEAESKLGFRFVCDEALTNAQTKLSYLGVDVHKLYHQQKQVLSEMVKMSS